MVEGYLITNSVLLVPEYFVPVFVIVNLPLVTFPGIETVILVELDTLITEHFIPPKRTMLFALVVLKLVPVNVTVVPAFPDVGLNDVIVGCATRLNANKNIRKKNISLLIEVLFDNIIWNMGLFRILLLKRKNKK
jgi:hypothetical protein